MSKPRLLDLFCGPGGAGMGYYFAGFDVTGVDIKPQKSFPFQFIQADALEYLREHGHEYDVVHASPPCQGYANVTLWRGKQEDHPRLIGTVRDILNDVGKPYVIENVRTKHLHTHFMLCGSMFGLRVQRHRYFEMPWIGMVMLPPCRHMDLLPFEHKGERAYADAMGCNWMGSKEAREAIPPAYTAFIGKQLLLHLEGKS